MDKYRSLFNLDGKVALVVGGGGDIGKAISEGLASFGATVVVCGRTLGKAQAVADGIVVAGGKASSAKLDVLDVKGVGCCVDDIVAQHGHVDILVNCVGTQIEAPAEEYKEEDWDRIFAVNLKSAFFLSQSVAKHQISGGGGKHIHVTSVRSALGIRRGFIGYCASKGGMNMMVKQLASEWAKYNICVNGIAPTFTRTELVRPYLDDPQFYNPLIARIPMGRIAETLDLAGLAIYLAASASDFTTGQIVYVDGGVTACQ